MSAREQLRTYYGWLDGATAESIARSVQVQVEVEKMLAKMRAKGYRPPLDLRDADQKDHDEEKEGSTR
jgi:hypothetical protein